MIVETHIFIAAAPKRVWHALVAFDDYPRWNPYREVLGRAGGGEKVVMRIGSTPGRRLRMKAVISEFETEKKITFRSGPIFARAMESFIVEPRLNGTLLRHVCVMPGLTGVLFKATNRNANLAKVYETVDQALAFYLGSGRPKTPRSQRGRLRI